MSLVGRENVTGNERKGGMREKMCQFVRKARKTGEEREGKN